MYNYNTLCDDFLQYKKFLGYKYNTENIVMAEIKKFLIQNNIDIITKEVTENYARLNPNLNSNTIARNVGVLREFCKYLKTQGIECYQIPSNLYPQKRHNLVPYIFTHEEINTMLYNSDKVFNYLTSYYKKTILPIILRNLYQTGMRVGEILNIQIKDYNYIDSYFHLHDTKNSEERLVVISSGLNELINNYHLKFHYHENLNDKFFKVSKSSIQIYFFKVLDKSGIKRNEHSPRVHDLRHTFIVHSLEKAIKERKNLDNYMKILQVYVGHKSLKALEYYFRITKSMINDINKISEDRYSYLVPTLEKLDYEE